MEKLGPFEVNSIVCGECSELMKQMPRECIDLTVTSPPYDNLRDYEGYTFDFGPIASELFRVTKIGGVVVWVVGDATIGGSETGTSFRQALKFMELGFRLHDTMIYQKRNPVPNETGRRYQACFEYMFVLAKERPRVFNPITIKAEIFGVFKPGKGGKDFRERGGEMRGAHSLKYNKPHKFKHNIWPYTLGGRKDHPATFPEDLVLDHILSWSNPGDIIFDPMCGSGTTLKVAEHLERRWLGFDISPKYVEMASKRLELYREKHGLRIF